MQSYYGETPSYSMKYMDQLDPGSVNREVLEYTREYLQALKSFYSATFKHASIEVDKIKKSFDLEELREMRSKHSNKRLREFVSNSKSLHLFTEHKGDMIQKKDPIYLDPTHKFVKAHFYAPRKMIAGNFVPTIWVNVMVIWLMTITLYLLLYFRALKKFMDLMERISSRKAY